MNDLLYLMARLRDPESGCPWDLEQDFASIAPYTLEEACEVVQAIETGDMVNFQEELGDLLFQVVFHAQMAKEAGQFEFEDVVSEIQSKLIRRHPHVFPDGELYSECNGALPLSSEDVQQRWQTIKQNEKAQKLQGRQSTSAMPEDLPATLPSLKKAEKIQAAAARVGFDWPDIEPVFDKIEEELQEIREAMAHEGPERIAEEVGDLLFAVVNLTRHLGLDGDMTLRKATNKFVRRFQSMETQSLQDGQVFEQLTLEEMEDYWQQVK